MNKRQIEECGSVWLWISAWGPPLSVYVCTGEGNSRVWFGLKMTGTLWEERGMNKRQIDKCGSVWLCTSAWGPPLSVYVKFGGSRANETAGFRWVQK